VPLSFRKVRLLFAEVAGARVVAAPAEAEPLKLR
jgi:hypothetical protein